LPFASEQPPCGSENPSIVPVGFFGFGHANVETSLVPESITYNNALVESPGDRPVIDAICDATGVTSL
jgi:hypothetical protein